MSIPREVIADILRQRMQVAQLAWKAACADRQEQKELSIDIPRPDGTLMRMGPFQTEAFFFGLYREALREFHDFVIHEKLPMDIEALAECAVRMAKEAEAVDRKQPASEGFLQRKAKAG